MVQEPSLDELSLLQEKSDPKKVKKKVMVRADRCVTVDVHILQ